MTNHPRYDAALTILEALLSDEEDFERAARLQAIILELAILKHTQDAPPRRAAKLTEFIARH